MRYSASDDLTTYVVSHKQGDNSARMLTDILNILLQTCSENAIFDVFLTDPFDIHTIFSTLSLEVSKQHVKRFQRFMWTQASENPPSNESMHAHNIYM